MKKLILFSAIFILAHAASGQWIYDNLMEPKYRQGVATLGNKAYFAGGQNDSLNLSLIEIYDVSTETWDSAINISVPRMHPTCAAGGEKLFVAGGINFFTMEFFDEIDIWDTQTKQWGLEHLLFPRFSISVASNGTKVLFAGGVNLNTGVVFDIVEIYDIETGEWDFATLSLPRSAMACAVVNDIAIFAGGYNMISMTDRVDIYNFTTNTWSTASLSEPRGVIAATAVGSKILIAGGTRSNNTPSDRVDIYDAETGLWSIATLSEPRAMFQESAASVCNTKACFAGGGVFNMEYNAWDSGSDVIDIYDADNDTWSVDHLTKPLIMHCVASAEDHLIIAGGATPGDPDWYLTSSAEIYMDPELDCYTGGESEVQSAKCKVQSYPNPTDGIVDFRFTVYNLGSMILTVFNAQGQEVAVVLDGELAAGENTVQWDAGALPAGIYYYQLRAEGIGQVGAGKIVKY